MNNVIKRDCVICGENLKIKLNKDKTYVGANYFGKMKFPIGKGRYIKVGKTNLLGKKS
ncbi:hypothetical protein KAI04_03545 [Candidatus Pacearchaeota archaeon]|nr:hypothetical protein [Candidatus Pacearchaeota archaeon]